MLSAHAKYARYLARHKWYVLLAGLRYGAPLWRLLVHDASKVRPSEWRPYVAYFYGSERTGAPRGQHDQPNRTAYAEQEKRVRQVAFDRAWLHHQHRNAHHWQAHILRNDDGTTVALPMPEPLVREMVSDWASAGRVITGRWEVRDWYLANKGRMLLHSDTRQRVEELLNIPSTDCGSPGGLMARDIQALRRRRITPIDVPRKRALVTMQVDLSASSTPWTNASPMRFTSSAVASLKTVSCSDVDWCAVCDKSLLTSQADALLVDEDNDAYLPIHPECRPTS